MIAYYPGVWDCVHAGHIIVLNKAKSMCNYLIIGVCSDELNIKLKGRKPLFNQYERRRLLEHLGFISIIYYDVCYHTHYNFDYFIHGPEFGQRQDQKDFFEWCYVNNKVLIKLDRIPTDVNISTTEIIRRAKELQ
jgi:glycerol-3-phosphate cytidylyltransferase